MALVVKNPPANAGYVRDMGLIPESGRSPGKGNGNPLWYSCLENPMDRGVWHAISMGSQKVPCGFDPWIGKIPWRKAWQPTLVFLPGESHGQRSLAGYSPRGHKELVTKQSTGLCI